VRTDLKSLYLNAANTLRPESATNFWIKYVHF